MYTGRFDRSTNYPIVSVIMNCLNCSKYLNEAIDSVYGQTFKDWEIIFWDNASTDNSADIAKSYDERLRCFKSEETAPLGEARNRAIEKARGKYISFLDCDDIWMPQKLEKQVALIEKSTKDSANIGICYTDSIRVGSSGEYLMDFSTGRQLQSGYTYEELIKDCFIACSSCTIVKDVLELTGIFNSKYTQVEEWDLWIRIAERHLVLCVKEVLTKIRIHGSNLSSSIMLNLDEGIEMISQIKIKSQDEHIRTVCKHKLKELKFRKKIAKILDNNKFIGFAKFKVFVRTFLFSILNPLTFLKYFLKYLSYKSYRLYKIKYFN